MAWHVKNALMLESSRCSGVLCICDDLLVGLGYFIRAHEPIAKFYQLFLPELT